jgi:hypothetical protein
MNERLAPAVMQGVVALPRKCRTPADAARFSFAIGNHPVLAISGGFMIISDRSTLLGWQGGHGRLFDPFKLDRPRLQPETHQSFEIRQTLPELLPGQTDGLSWFSA